MEDVAEVPPPLPPKTASAPRLQPQYQQRPHQCHSPDLPRQTAVQTVFLPPSPPLTPPLSPGPARSVSGKSTMATRRRKFSAAAASLTAETRRRMSIPKIVAERGSGKAASLQRSDSAMSFASADAFCKSPTGFEQYASDERDERVPSPVAVTLNRPRPVPLVNGGHGRSDAGSGTVDAQLHRRARSSGDLHARAASTGLLTPSPSPTSLNSLRSQQQQQHNHLGHRTKTSLSSVESADTGDSEILLDDRDVRLVVGSTKQPVQPRVVASVRGRRSYDALSAQPSQVDHGRYCQRDYAWI